MIRLKNILKEMAIPKAVYSQIQPTDRIIMSDDEEIIPRDTAQPAAASFKPRGLWYAIGTEWIDWVRDNMSHWESDHAFKLELDDSKILHLGKDMSFTEFEEKFGVKNYGMDVVTDIKWWKVKAYDAGRYSGIEIEHPWGPKPGHWERTWDISSGCIWRANAIKGINKINLVNDKPKYDASGIDTPGDPNM